LHSDPLSPSVDLDMTVKESDLINGHLSHISLLPYP